MEKQTKQSLLDLIESSNLPFVKNLLRNKVIYVTETEYKDCVAIMRIFTPPEDTPASDYMCVSKPILMIDNSQYGMITITNYLPRAYELSHKGFKIDKLLAELDGWLEI